MRSYYTKSIREGMPPVISDLPPELQELANPVLELARCVGNESSEGSDSDPSGDEVGQFNAVFTPVSRHFNPILNAKFNANLTPFSPRFHAISTPF
jgi:hypothetical protein